MNASILLIISIVLLVLSGAAAIYAFIWLRRVSTIRTEFSSGGHAENLEEIISSIARKIKLLEQDSEEQNSKLEKLNTNLGFAIQKIGVHRFNALADEGGNLSFTLALLNRHDSGLVITSMHGRQHNRVYSKPVIEKGSTVQLSEEEQKAIQNANQISN